MSSLHFCLLSLSLFIIFVFLLKHKRNHASNTTTHPAPPGPQPLPLIGNLHQLDLSALHCCLRQLSQFHGPLMSLKLGLTPMLVISSAKTVREAIKANDLKFSSRPSLVGQQKLSYGGLDMAFAPYGEHWRRTRRISMVNLLNPKRVQSFRPIREDEVSKMVERISHAAAASCWHTVNLSETLLLLTASIICRIAFGKNYIIEPEPRIHVLTSLREAQTLLGSLFFEDHFGWAGSVVDKVTGFSSKLQRVFVELDSFYEMMIRDHLEKKKEREDRDDFVDVLLRTSEDRSGSAHVGRDHVKAVLMNIFIGATDTNAATLVWAMMALKKNPRVMNKAQSEIRSLVRSKGFVDEDDLLCLPYLKAVVKETLRLYPPAPLLLPRETTQRCIVSGYEIRPKTLVSINAWAIGRGGEYWESAEEFRPERFLESDVDISGQSFEFLPFGCGRRVCPGMSLGVVTMELALANLLYSFEWELPEGMEEEEEGDTEATPGITMHKKIPLCLIAKIRNCA
ncbi:hypothetical protein BT93_J0357 [Corymbia citriodora subsp. variegata]|nr:hypothetical protein BT93_J0357 [Corymbia citriodora subsp. variegata]